MRKGSRDGLHFEILRHRKFSSGLTEKASKNRPQKTDGIYYLSMKDIWEDNIKMDLQEVGGGCGDWMERAQDRDRWRALMNFRVP
jgi:hypothetical protein